MLTAREQAFVDAYIGAARGNATKAAILAGYSEKTAAQQASRLLRRSSIAVKVEQAAKQAVEEKRIVAVVLNDAAIADAAQIDSVLTSIMADRAANHIARIMAARELNAVQGRHIKKHELTVKRSLEDILAEANTLPAQSSESLDTMALVHRAETVQ